MKRGKNNLIKITVGVLMTVLMSGGANATVIFEDNFSDPNLSKWILFGYPSPVVLSEVEDKNGVFDNNGDDSYASGAISKDNFDFANNLPIEIESDVFIDIKNPSGCWDIAGIGITKDQSPSKGLFFGISYSGDACWGAPPERRGHACFMIEYLTEDGDSVSFGYECTGDVLINADEYTNKWVKLKVVINEDRFIKFYADDNLVYKSDKKIDESVLKNKKLYLGERSANSAGKAYHDYIKVYSKKQKPEPFLQIIPPKYTVESNPYDICVCEKALHAVDTSNSWGWWLAQPCLCLKKDRTFWYEDVCTAKKAWGYYWAFTWHNLCANFPTNATATGNPWPMNTTQILKLENETIEIV